MKKKIILLVFAMILIFLYGCNNEDLKPFKINDIMLDVEFADTYEEKTKGLMNRESLEENEGMFFLFEENAILSFWMKDTLIPLDIFFIDSDKMIVDIQTMQPCSKEPCKIYYSNTPARYALELNAGFAEKNEIQIGDKVTW